MQDLRFYLGRLMLLALAVEPLLSQQAKAPALQNAHKSRTDPTTNTLSGDERILHALNRFTFGPRPGDLELVRQLGLDQWLELQLHPASLDVTDLNRRLSQFPALRLTTQQLLTAFPSGAIIRQAADGKIPIPNTPILAAVYSDQIAFYKEREARKAEKQPEAIAGPAPNQDSMQAAMTSSPKAGMSEAIKGSIDAPLATDAKPDPEVLAILALPPAQRVKRLISMPPQQLEEFRESIKGPRRTQLLDKMTPGQREIVADLENPSKAVVDEMTEQRLIRDVYSPAQLQEVMTDFWLNHFNVFLHKNEETPYHLVSFERDVIRPRALGRFENLLVGTAESPAMMLYLDNSSSMGPDSTVAEKDKQRAAKQNKPAPASGLNENYARELMELHTLGVNGGYTQQDVTEMARVFTGWTVDQPARGGGFLFDERKHEPGVKKVLGIKVKEGGQNEGLEMLHVLATRPATARFLSRKLAIRFVSDDPPQSLVDRMAKSYLASDGDIATVLRTMFHSPEFWQRKVYRAKVKTPLEYVASAVRASNSQTGSMIQLTYALNRMGMPLYGCVPPTGYSSKAEAWVNTGALVSRMNFALSLASNKLADIHIDWSDGAGDGDLGREVANDGSQVDPAADEKWLERRILESDGSQQTLEAIMKQVESAAVSQSGNAQVLITPAGTVANAAAQVNSRPDHSRLPGNSTAVTREAQDALIAGLLLGSPEFQRR